MDTTAAEDFEDGEPIKQEPGKEVRSATELNTLQQRESDTTPSDPSSHQNNHQTSSSPPEQYTESNIAEVSPHEGDDKDDGMDKELIPLQEPSTGSVEEPNENNSTGSPALQSTESKNSSHAVITENIQNDQKLDNSVHASHLSQSIIGPSDSKDAQNQVNEEESMSQQAHDEEKQNAEYLENQALNDQKLLSDQQPTDLQLQATVDESDAQNQQIRDDADSEQNKSPHSEIGVPRVLTFAMDEVSADEQNYEVDASQVSNSDNKSTSSIFEINIIAIQAPTANSTQANNKTLYPILTKELKREAVIQRLIRDEELDQLISDPNQFSKFHPPTERELEEKRHVSGWQTRHMLLTFEQFQSERGRKNQNIDKSNINALLSYFIYATEKIQSVKQNSSQTQRNTTRKVSPTQQTEISSMSTESYAEWINNRRTRKTEKQRHNMEKKLQVQAELDAQIEKIVERAKEKEELHKQHIAEQNLAREKARLQREEQIAQIQKLHEERLKQKRENAMAKVAKVYREKPNKSQDTDRGSSQMWQNESKGSTTKLRISELEQNYTKELEKLENDIFLQQQMHHQRKREIDEKRQKELKKQHEANLQLLTLREQRLSEKEAKIISSYVEKQSKVQEKRQGIVANGRDPAMAREEWHKRQRERDTIRLNEEKIARERLQTFRKQQEEALIREQERQAILQERLQQRQEEDAARREQTRQLKAYQLSLRQAAADAVAKKHEDKTRQRQKYLAGLDSTYSKYRQRLHENEEFYERAIADR